MTGYVSLSKAAALLGRTSDELRKVYERGDLPWPCKAGRTYVLSPHEYEAARRALEGRPDGATPQPTTEARP